MKWKYSVSVRIMWNIEYKYYYIQYQTWGLFPSFWKEPDYDLHLSWIKTTPVFNQFKTEREAIQQGRIFARRLFNKLNCTNEIQVYEFDIDSHTEQPYEEKKK